MRNRYYEEPNTPRALSLNRSGARERGLTDWQWRSPTLVRPFYGVRTLSVTTAPNDSPQDGIPVHPAKQWRDDHIQLALAYTTVMKPSEFFAGITAAIIWKLPVPVDPRAPQIIEVGVCERQPFPRRTGVRGRRFTARLVTVVRKDGLRTLDPVSIWVTYAPSLRLPDRVALGDAVIHTPRIGGNLGPRPRLAHATLERLTTETEQPERRGRSLLREALPLLRTDSASAPETHLRLAVVEAGLPEPNLDVDVYGPDQRYLGTSECAYSEFKIVLEYEGDHHRTETKQWDRDIDKYHDYENAGWIVLRITARLLYRRRAVLIENVTNALVSRGWKPTLTATGLRS